MQKQLNRFKSVQDYINSKKQLTNQTPIKQSIIDLPKKELLKIDPTYSESKSKDPIFEGETILNNVSQVSFNNYRQEEGEEEFYNYQELTRQEWQVDFDEINEDFLK